VEQLVTITIFGQTFNFRSEGEGDRAQEVADFLAREVVRIENQQAVAMTDRNKLAILISAALNIANENMELRSSYSDFQHQITHRTAGLLDLLDSVLRPGA
jgi:cell division protein ZapA (FtsZ GTPase activity inhibitor)